MPAKHYSPTASVRFASTVQESSPYAGAYSSPRSGSSSSVSPHATNYGSMVATLPPLGCSIHPAIDASRQIYVSWKAFVPPSIHPGFLHSGATPAVFNEAATNPPLPYLDITIPQLPWAVRVVPQNKQLPFVTVMDLLFCLYSQLRLTVTEKEMARFYPSSEAQQMVTSAYQARCNIPGASQAECLKERNKGVKRVDCLGRQTRFAGLMHAKTANGDPHAFEVRFT